MYCNFWASAPIWFLVLQLCCAGRRRIHQRVNGRFYAQAQLQIKLGTPPKVETYSLDLRFSDLIFLDLDCRYPAHTLKCPRFCSDEAIHRAYCRSLCQRASRRCGDEGNALNSTTYRDLHEEIWLIYRGYRPFFGLRAKDNFLFEAQKFNKSARADFSGLNYGLRTVFDLKGEPFVRGMSADIRWINKNPGILGLRHGQNSFIPRLKSKGLLDSAVISIQRDWYSMYSATFLRNMETVMFGMLDKFACNWRRLPAHTPEEWSFEISNVKFLDIEIPGTNIARLALDTEWVQIPIELANRYIHSGLFEYEVDRSGDREGKIDRDNLVFTVAAANLSKLYFEFRFGGELVRFTSKMMIVGKPTVAPARQRTILGPGSERRYANEAHWVIGTRALEYFCFGYDYESAEVALGWRRRPRDSTYSR